MPHLVDVYRTAYGRGYGLISYPDYPYYRKHIHTISHLAAQYATVPINMVVSHTSQQINGSVVSWNYFSLLKLTPALGRMILRQGAGLAFPGGQSAWRCRRVIFPRAARCEWAP